MRGRFTGLWRHPDFLRLWAGQTISVFGSLTTRLALPFTAIVYLDAPAVQSGAHHVRRCARGDLLRALRRRMGRPSAPAADHDRRRHRARGDHRLRAVGGGVRRVAHRAALRRRVSRGHPHDVLRRRVPVVSADAHRDRRPDRGKQQAGGERVRRGVRFVQRGGLARAAGQRPGAMAIDAVSFLFSAASLRAIRTPEPPPAPVEAPAQRASRRLSRACARSGTNRACGSIAGSHVAAVGRGRHVRRASSCSS